MKMKANKKLKQANNKHKHVSWTSHSQNKFKHKAGACKIPPLTESCCHLIVARRGGRLFNEIILDRLITHQHRPDSMGSMRKEKTKSNFKAGWKGVGLHKVG